MGDVLAGNQAIWEFDTDSVLIRFERGIRAPRLFHRLRERRIPYAALSSVTLTPGKRGTVVLHAVPRPGADPLLQAAAGQLKDDCDPYRLVLPAGREALAAHYTDELRALLGPDAALPADRFMIAAPRAPLHFKAYDGRAGFDGKQVSFRWSRTGASSAKWKAGDQIFPVTELSGVEWRSPESPGGCLRLVRRGAGTPDPDAVGPGGAPGPAGGGTAPAAGVLPHLAGEDAGRPRADQDPAAVLFGSGYGPVHESLPFAAAVLESVRGRQPAPAMAAPAPSGTARITQTARATRTARREPAEVAERIRHLGDLREAGLLTDEEYSAKRAQLLAEL